MEKPPFNKLIDEFNAANPLEILRLGQWFINSFDPLSDNLELFYCIDQKHAMSLIKDQYYK